MRYLNTAAVALVIATVVFVCVSPASADLIHGFTDLNDGGIDFSTQQTTFDRDLVDVELVDIFDPPLGWRLFGIWDYRLYMVDESLDSVTTAPADTTLYTYILEVRTDVTYVVRTRDGLYAKFAVRVWEPWVTAEIEYYVQPDGSRNLDNTVSTESTTWGRLKALYQ